MPVVCCLVVPGAGHDVDELWECDGNRVDCILVPKVMYLVRVLQGSGSHNRSSREYDSVQHKVHTRFDMVVQGEKTFTVKCVMLGFQLLNRCGERSSCTLKAAACLRGVPKVLLRERRAGHC